MHLGKLIVSFEGTLGTGDVKIEGGTLELANTEGSIDDEAKLVIAAGAKVMLHDNVNEKVALLILDGARQSPGLTFGSTDSEADVQIDSYFSGPGIIRTAHSTTTLIVLQ